jgi:hypothetical protein
MGAQGTDILLSERAAKCFPFAIEAKNQEKVSIWEAWKQAKENTSDKLPYPLLVIKRNNEEPLVVIDAKLFIQTIAMAVNG